VVAPAALLCLEAFQSGLSWLTILGKRDGSRRAFAGFDPSAVARFTDTDVARLLVDSAIMRHPGKILATIGNARAAVRLWEQGMSLAGLLWSFEATGRRSTPDRCRVAGVDSRVGSLLP